MTLNPAEWQIMSAVWELGKADAGQVSVLLGERQRRAYSPKTAGIFLARLAGKGLLRKQRIKPAGPGRPAFLYSPVLDRQDALRRQIERFLTEYALEESDFEALRAMLAASREALRRIASRS